VIRPKGVNLHYEVELALILGKRVRDLNEQDEQAALDAIESELCPLPPRLACCAVLC
jgi:hypothetical protein